MKIRPYLFIVSISLWVLLWNFSSLNAAIFEYPTLYKDFRVLGMGGAAIAIGDGSVSVFYNPAKLSQMKRQYGFEVRIPEISLGFSKNSIDFYNDLKDAIDTGDLNGDGDDEDDKLRAINDVLFDYIGDTFNNQIEALISIAKNHEALAWTFGVFGNLNTSYLIHQGFGSSGVLEIKAWGGGGAFIGVSKNLLDEKLSLGVDAKLLYFSYLNHAFYPLELVEHSEDMDTYITDDLLYKGTSFTFDIGAIFTPWPTSFWKPSFGLSAMNLMEIKLENDEGQETTFIPSTYNIGMALNPQISSYFPFIKDLILGLDVVDITRNYNEDEDWGKRLRLGVELKLIDNKATMLSLRGGLYQGYPSFGIDARLLTFDLQFVSYAEEMGAYAGQSENRRYLFNFAFRW